MKNSKKIIGVTIGDPAGVGVEIIAKLIADKDFYKSYPFIPIGVRFVFDKFYDLYPTLRPNSLDIIDMEGIAPFQFEYGKYSAQCGELSMMVVKKAVTLALSNQIDAVVTTPINKHSISLAGYDFPGHTEYLGELTNTKDFAMMLATKNLKVVLVTTHLSISKLAQNITIEKVLNAIRNAHKAGGYFGIKRPRVAVAALNPHAGDNGTIGDEEINIIIPAIKKAIDEGIDARGPFPADTMFSNKEGFDIAVAMYHDQGLIPIKIDGLGGAVNITLNLPIIRTSVDHGTAFDIAGQGVANPESLKTAIIIATKMAEHSNFFQKGNHD